MKKTLSFLMILLLTLALLDATLAEKQSSEKLILEAESVELLVGDTLQLTAKSADPAISLEGLVYITNKPKYAAVNEAGLLTAVSPGRVKVSVKTADGKHSATLSVKIMAAPESVKITAKKLTLMAGKTTTLAASVLPKSSVENQKVIWQSSDETVAIVSEKGVVTGVGPGNVTITAASVLLPSVFSTKEMEVIQLANKVTLSAEASSILVGETLSLNCQLEPENVSSREVAFKSDKTRVATVSEDGVITGVKAGKATITVTTKDGSKKTGKFVVEVIQPVRGVYINEYDVTIGVGDTKTIVAELDPEDSTNKNMAWFSDDPTVATVSGTTNKAKITVHAWGEATITGTTEDGGFTDRLYVYGGLERFAIRLRRAYRDETGRLHLVLFNESNMSIGAVRMAIKGFDAYGQPVSMSNPSAPMIESDEEGMGIEPCDMPEGGFSADAMIVNAITYTNFETGQENDVKDLIYIRSTDSIDSAATLSIAVTGYTCLDAYKFDISQNHWVWVPVE